MINPITWFVLSLLSSATQVGNAISDGAYNAFEILLAVISGIIVGGVWAFIAGWLRVKFFMNISDSYIKKIQIVLLIIGLLLVSSIIFHA